MKAISIIIPCYNVENYIQRCMISLLNQTIGLEKLELIFVNDASTDNTLEILKEYEQKYSEHILIVDLDKNRKQGGARNVGLQYASCDYIAFVDADDWVELTMYEKLYTKAIEYDCDLVHCEHKRVLNSEMSMGLTGYEDKLYKIDTLDERRWLLLYGKIGGVWSNIYRKKLIDDNQIIFPENITYEDNFWLSLLLLYVKQYYKIEEFLYHYFLNNESTVSVKNSAHHFDRLIIELMKVEEYTKREFMSVLYKEIEIMFVKLYFINTLHIMLSRFSEPPIEIFYQMQNTLLKCFPNYKENKYIGTYLSNTDVVLMQLAERVISQDELSQTAENYRKALSLLDEYSKRTY